MVEPHDKRHTNERGTRKSTCMLVAAIRWLWKSCKSVLFFVFGQTEAAPAAKKAHDDERIGELQMESESNKVQIKQLEDQIEELQRSREIETSQKDLRIRTLRSQRKALEDDTANLKDRINHLQRQWQIQKAQIAATQKLVSDNAELKNQINQLETYIQAQNGAVAKAQEIVLKNAEIYPSNRDDDTIELEFGVLQMWIETWGEKWNGGSITHILEAKSDDRKKAFEALKTVVRFDSDEFPDSLQSSEMDGITTGICLTAYLGSEICRWIFEKPFALLEYGDSIDQRGSVAESEQVEVLISGDRSIYNIYEELQKIDESKAHYWRVRMLQIIDPHRSPGEYRKNIIRAHEQASKRRSIAAHKLTSEFIDSPAARFLMKRTSATELESCRRSLIEIIQNALEMSSRLWRGGRSMIRCKRIINTSEDLFNHKSNIMKAYSRHMIGIGLPKDDRLDNQRARVMVFPAVLVYGTPDTGERYSTDIAAWAKTVLLMDD